MSLFKETLSDAGAARRDAMLRELQRAVVRRRRLRTALRSSAGLLTVTTILALVILYDRPSSELAPKESPPSFPVLTSVHLKIVHDEPGIVARHLVETRPIDPKIILDDDALLESLAAIGRPTGLIRVQGKLILTEKVADEPPG